MGAGSAAAWQQGTGSGSGQEGAAERGKASSAGMGLSSARQRLERDLEVMENHSIFRLAGLIAAPKTLYGDSEKSVRKINVKSFLNLPFSLAFRQKRG